MPKWTNATWGKPHNSQDNGECVEVAYSEGWIGVRDSKNASGPVLEFTEREWVVFLDAAVGGQFNLQTLKG